MVNYKNQIKKFNQPQPLLDYFLPMIGDKKSVRIADLGSGPYPITGQTLDGVEVKFYNSDKRNFSEFWDKYESVPTFPLEIQDMEKLTYEDNFFDIVHCLNALDHTVNALTAVSEMIRVCKSGGWVYIDCALIQKTAHRKKHYWDALEDGTFVNPTNKFSLKELGFSIELVDNGGERQYNHIIAKFKK